jgi:3-phenylpropionate/trans-cinnamate dioxygenase ferredoxin subunit
VSVGELAAAPDGDGFVRVADSREIIEDAVLAVSLGSVALALVRSGGRLYAVAGRCSHQECPLSSGFVEDDQIECECHGARFDLRTGAPTFPTATTAIAVFAIREHSGAVYVRLERP